MKEKADLSIIFENFEQRFGKTSSLLNIEEMLKKIMSISKFKKKLLEL